MTNKNKISIAILLLTLINLVTVPIIKYIFPSKEYNEFSVYEKESEKYNNIVKKYQNENYVEILRYYNEMALTGKVLPTIILDTPSKYDLDGKYIQVSNITLNFRNLYISNFPINEEKAFNIKIEILEKTIKQLGVLNNTEKNSLYNCVNVPNNKNELCYFSGYLSSFNDKDHVLRLLSGDVSSVGGLPPTPPGLIEPIKVNKPEKETDVPKIAVPIWFIFHGVYVTGSILWIWLIPLFRKFINNKKELAVAKKEEKDSNSIEQNMSYRQHICSTCGKS